MTTTTAAVCAWLLFTLTVSVIMTVYIRRERRNARQRRLYARLTETIVRGRR